MLDTYLKEHSQDLCTKFWWEKTWKTKK